MNDPLINSSLIDLNAWERRFLLGRWNVKLEIKKFGASACWSACCSFVFRLVCLGTLSSLPGTRKLWVATSMKLLHCCFVWLPVLCNHLTAMLSSEYQPWMLSVANTIPTTNVIKLIIWTNITNIMNCDYDQPQVESDCENAVHSMHWVPRWACSHRR